MGWLGSVGGIAKNILGKNSEKAVQEHLRQYIGQVVLVGGLPDEEITETGLQLVRRSTGILDSRGLMRPHKTIGIRPMVPSTQMEEPVSLLRTAKALQESMAENYGMLPILYKEPIRCEPCTSGKSSTQAFRALHEALHQFEVRTGQEKSWSDRRQSLGFVAVVNAGYAGRTMQRFHISDLENGGVAELDRVGEHSQDNVWVAY